MNKGASVPDRATHEPGLASRPGHSVSVPCAWRTFSAQYVAGERLYTGRVLVAEAFYNGMRSRGDPNAYSANVFLPGVKKSKVVGETIEVVKDEAERIVRAWFDAALVAQPLAEKR